MFAAGDSHRATSIAARSSRSHRRHRVCIVLLTRMSEAREPNTLIQAAEASAEAGNYASAEDLLREAARLQEASLGPRHPDLANTLNNIGVVCEVTGKPDEAEQYFRRAVSIARTSLHPDHPFVATSQKNLRDFCEARGKKVELPAPATEVPKTGALQQRPTRNRRIRRLRRRDSFAGSRSARWDRSPC